MLLQLDLVGRDEYLELREARGEKLAQMIEMYVGEVRHLA